jgi:hypothetical protein
MEVIGVPLAPTALSQKKDHPVAIEWEADWWPERVWAFWRGQKSVATAGVRNQDRPARNIVTVPTSFSRVPEKERREWSKNRNW